MKPILLLDKERSKWTSMNTDKHVEYSCLTSESSSLSRSVALTSFSKAVSFFHFKSFCCCYLFFLTNLLFNRSFLEHVYDLKKGGRWLQKLLFFPFFSKAHFIPSDICGLVETQQTAWAYSAMGKDISLHWGISALRASITHSLLG